MSQEKLTREKIWSQYWGTGQLHSCGGSFPGNYDGEVGKFWIDIFSKLTVNQSSVLDLATGNGALPELLIKTRPDLVNTTIHAVDLAEMQPLWLASLPFEKKAKIKFYPKTTMENLPFESHSQDCVISSFGVEYGNFVQTHQEIMRVVKQEVMIAFVMHSKDSYLAEVARQECAHAQWLMQSGIFEAASTLLPYLHQCRTSNGLEQVKNNPQANKARENLNQLMVAAQNQAKTVQVPDLYIDIQRSIGAILNRVITETIEWALDAINHIQQGLEAHLFRQQELLAHALDEVQLTALNNFYTQYGFNIKIYPLMYENDHINKKIGHTFTAVRK